MSEILVLRKPDDMHLHLRAEKMLERTVLDAAKQFRRAIVMPNLVPPITNVASARKYHQQILDAVPAEKIFTPLMTLYLTNQTTTEDIISAHESGFIFAAKLYPAGATTNSASGVTNLNKIDGVLATMSDLKMPLLVHAEVTNSKIDIFAREREFVQHKLVPLITKHPKLKIVIEHITTKDAVDFVLQSSANIAATITPQHLLYNRNHLLVGGIHPHLYCLPILKRADHQQALVQAAISGNAKFFLGTDSAPHPQSAKESACGCAGCYSAFNAIELYAEVFSQNNALDKLENFASFYGANFYGLPVNEEKITLMKKSWRVPAKLAAANGNLIPLKANEELSWQIVN